MALVRHFEADKAYAGLLIDGVAGTPYVVATLTLTAGNGLLVEVPYATVKNAAQFQTVDRWFESREIPEAFQFRGDEIEVTLYGCRMSGRTRHFGRQLAVGRFVAQHAVLGLREVSESFDVLTVRSRLDGLREWTGFTATNVDPDVDEHSVVHGVTITVQSTSELTWRQGDATMVIGTEWEGTDATTGAHIDEWVTLSSSFEKPQSPDAHIKAQKVVRDLLVLNFGTPLRFRRHALRDPSMPIPRHDESDPVHLPHRDLLLRETTWDHFQPAVEEQLLRRPIGWAGNYTEQALEAWANLHAEWARAVQPLESLLNREWFTTEDVVLGANISLEATGHLLNHVPGEEETYRNPAKPNSATTATRVLRALHAVTADWSRFGVTDIGLARLIANTYNSIKHYDRPQAENEDHVRLVADISQIVARLAILAQLPGSQEIISGYCEDYEFGNVMGGFKHLRVTLTNDGDLVPWASGSGRD